jgi:hypothetical protein
LKKYDDLFPNSAKLTSIQGATMNALNQIANEAVTFDNIDSSEQPLLTLDALDLVAVGGGGDAVFL